jgi:multicomponent Na+:H+ antiporter subunit B
VAPEYVDYSKKHLMPPNIVTAVLADFRGFDTLGETTVVFTAGIGVLLLLQGGWRISAGTSRKEEDEDKTEASGGDGTA